MVSLKKKVTLRTKTVAPTVTPSQASTSAPASQGGGKGKWVAGGLILAALVGGGIYAFRSQNGGNTAAGPMADTTAVAKTDTSATMAENTDSAAAATAPATDTTVIANAGEPASQTEEKPASAGQTNPAPGNTESAQTATKGSASANVPKTTPRGKVSRSVPANHNQIRKEGGNTVCLFSLASNAFIDDNTYADLAQKVKSGQKIVVKGYADPSGSEAYNKKLSQRRANAIRQYLIRKGVKASAIRAIGMGPTSQFGADEENRRVVVSVK
jgi:outer membrane protein OmpA-like peptidoglycan-associated protein